MSTHSDLKILMLEDVPEEAEVLERELRKAGLTFNAQRVQTKADFAAALEEFAPDLILADAKLPAFDGRSALQMVRDRRRRIPVIMVTGALGDEAAVEYLLAGAAPCEFDAGRGKLPHALGNARTHESENRRGAGPLMQAYDQPAVGQHSVRMRQRIGGQGLGEPQAFVELDRGAHIIDRDAGLVKSPQQGQWRARPHAEVPRAVLGRRPCPACVQP